LAHSVGHFRPEDGSRFVQTAIYYLYSVSSKKTTIWTSKYLNTSHVKYSVGLPLNHVVLNKERVNLKD
jgi:hypothetical protein